jgi:transaldolase
MTKIFLDSGNPEETKKALALLDHLDGQTTNPSLVIKNPEIQAHLASGGKFTRQEIMQKYKQIVQEISKLIPDGSVSIEVFATEKSTTADLLAQAREMNTWIPNAHIKFPITKNALQACHEFVKEGGRVNMTLCFSLAQAAGIYSATQGAFKGQVFYSSFVGRVFDAGFDGIEQLKQVQQLYLKGDGHVEILACSFRSYEQFLASLQVGVDICTVPFNLLEKWAENNKQIPDETWTFDNKDAEKPHFIDYSLSGDYKSFYLPHKQTTQGIAKFVTDWESVLND